MNECSILVLGFDCDSSFSLVWPFFRQLNIKKVLVSGGSLDHRVAPQILNEGRGEKVAVLALDEAGRVSALRKNERFSSCWLEPEASLRHSGVSVVHQLAGVRKSIMLLSFTVLHFPPCYLTYGVSRHLHNLRSGQPIWGHMDVTSD